ncbi:unnamed protein product [Parnassius mnemosyne]|uniref:PiggyBac transposable element-derived protein domain-containing protein n=1 Tax=Parnassius mnemosyne TaxID=213953 RepID=A0AAV1L925_9NEOP
MKDDDIENMLMRLEAGEISEDDAESDEDDLDFYPSRKDLQAVLEDKEVSDEEEVPETEECPDPPLVHEEIYQQASTSRSNVFPQINTRNLIWKKRSLEYKEESIAFLGSTELGPELMKLETPLQFFSQYFSEDLLKKIVEETNKYSTQTNIDRPVQISLTELRKYLGILIFMSVYRYPSVRSYWSSKFGFRPIIEAMPVNKFEKVRSILHFNDNNLHKPVGSPDHDKLHKLRPIIDHLTMKFSSVPMEQRLSVDEQMCATKISHFLKQYLPNKPHKWGFKLFALCSLAGYCYDFIIYSGTDKEPMRSNEPDIGVTGNTVIKLTRRVPRMMNHVIYFDNYYTSLPLMYYMAKEGIWCLGTVQLNRLGKSCKLPKKKEVMNSNVPRGSYVENTTSLDGVDFSAISWKDNKQVTLLSTYIGAEPVETIERYDKNQKKKVPIPCPKIIKEYNAHMGGVDLMDSFLGRYHIKVKSRKWYMRIFYHLLDLSVINSWILYKKVSAKKNLNPKQVLNLAEFRAELADALCKYGEHVVPSRGRPSRNFSEEPAPKRKNIQQVMPSRDVRYDGVDHIQSRQQNRMRCMNPGCKLLSSIMCLKCKVYLCSNKKTTDCFNDFHL